ncbi:copper amine oxidase N-terminal domain-containing protein [Neobacillus mesonae]|nr:copper amine oxidase N-terminal domain-containing protein [Neobacillus mesonae]
MRKIMMLTVLLMLAGYSITTSADAKEVSVSATVESGKFKELSSLKEPVIISDGRVLLPARELGDVLSLKVYWDSKTKTTSLYGVDKEVKITIGSKTAYVDNEKVSLEAHAQIIQGKTYIPLRFVASAFGETVAWNGAAQILTISSSYAMGTDKDITYWVHLESGDLFQAEGKETGTKIDHLQIQLETSRSFSVTKLSDSSAYLRFYEEGGPSWTVKEAGQAFVLKDKVVDEGNFMVIGFYPDTNIGQINGQVFITNGKVMKLMDKEGKVSAEHNLTELMNKDEIYMVEHYDEQFMVLREYSSQHLIIYSFSSDKATYVHEVINLPSAERHYLEAAGLDRNNETEYDHIIYYDSTEQDKLTFNYKSKETDQVNSYSLQLDQL